MARTQPRIPALRATALLTAAVLSGSVLAGCSAEGDPEAGAATPGASPTRSAATEEASPTPTAAAEPSAEAPDDATGKPDDAGEPGAGGEAGDDGEVAGASEDDEAHADRDGQRDDADENAGSGKDAADGEREDENGDGSGKDGDEDEAQEPELPEFVAYGETSERVGELQARLQDLGYHVTSVDGSYGGETQQALWAFQKAAGLYRDGVVGPATQQALDNGVVPQPRSSSGKVIEIDIDRQLMLAVENGVVVKTLNAASGNGERYTAKGSTYWATTPRGDFAIYNEINGVHASTLELGDMNRPKYFNGGIALHGSDSVPPFPASHGCVRVSHSAINWIWDTWGAPRGTRVLVY
ncbi:L,D-transpeptidase family protein [Myceligenerans crystallogenes]|uniref:L,D-TPase catalytic domain-containing protein n=1 Tax=Myceligenerans crystallogenes TaxID=316335 RepID=A0ABN2N2Y5_9MICO